MDGTQLEMLAALRAAVGFLGEREQYGWWQSSFFSAGSRAFLAPVFGRTPLLAQCAGVTRAAGLVHDDRIGVGRVFHLFRLPEAVEQGLHRALQQPDAAGRIAPITAGREAALLHLQTLARGAAGAGVGPTRVGGAGRLGEPQTWRTVAAHYAGAFAAGQAVFPFFTDAL